MADLVLDALAEAFQAEIKHTYSITSRDYKHHGGVEAGAKVLFERIKVLRLYHDAIVDLLEDAK
jgi:hypothetical protein